MTGTVSSDLLGLPEETNPIHGDHDLNLGPRLAHGQETL